jgi:hypothetical protein
MIHLELRVTHLKNCTNITSEQATIIMCIIMHNAQLILLSDGARMTILTKLFYILHKLYIKLIDQNT